MNRNILVVDDNLTICLMLKSWLVSKDYTIETATDVNVAKQMVKEQPFDLILTDIKMPEEDGFAFLSWVKRYDPDILVVMMTGYADIESAVASIKSGASDYIPKPIEPEELFRKIDEAFKSMENRKKREKFYNEFIMPPDDLCADLMTQLDQVAVNNKHLLIIGGRGTGKRSIVKYIHEKAHPLNKPLVILDADYSFSQICQRASLNNAVVRGTKSLFMQRFKKAKGGLFYIREVDMLAINLQDELLTILTRQKRDDDFIQVIVSTEKSRDELQRILIPKLYHLLVKDCLLIPSLKGRKEVILSFISHFLSYANFILDKKIESIDATLQEQLITYRWPGNIQELKNMVIKAALLTEGREIPLKIASELFGNKESKKENYFITGNSFHKLRKENYEKEKIMEALELSKGNKTMAASILNIDRKTLYNKIKLYGVTL